MRFLSVGKQGGRVVRSSSSNLTRQNRQADRQTDRQTNDQTINQSNKQNDVLRSLLSLSPHDESKGRIPWIDHILSLSLSLSLSFIHVYHRGLPSLCCCNKMNWQEMRRMPHSQRHCGHVCLCEHELCRLENEHQSWASKLVTKADGF